jgi:hypothetical protein
VQTVKDNFASAFALALRLDGQLRDIWVTDVAGGLRPLESVDTPGQILCLWYEDATSYKALIGSDVIFTADAVLLTWAELWPRRPNATELVYSPKNICYAITEVQEPQGIYQIALERRAGQTGRFKQ